MDGKSGERCRTDENGSKKALDPQSDLRSDVNGKQARAIRSFGPPGGLTGSLIAGAIGKSKETLQRDQLGVHQGQKPVL